MAKRKSKKPRKSPRDVPGVDPKRTSREGDITPQLQLWDADGNPVHVGSGIAKPSKLTPKQLEQAKAITGAGEPSLAEMQAAFIGGAEDVELGPVTVATGELYEKILMQSEPDSES